MKTLLLALVGPDAQAGTREGAIRGLVGVGKEAVRKALVDGGGARVVGEGRDDGEVERAVMASCLFREMRNSQSNTRTGCVTGASTAIYYTDTGRPVGPDACQPAQGGFRGYVRAEANAGRCMGEGTVGRRRGGFGGDVASQGC